MPFTENPDIGCGLLLCYDSIRDHLGQFFFFFFFFDSDFSINFQICFKVTFEQEVKLLDINKLICKVAPLPRQLLPLRSAGDSLSFHISINNLYFRTLNGASLMLRSTS